MQTANRGRADVVVIGAGPAGSAAAIALTRLNRRVIVVDKANFPRDKCCGDGLTVAALRRLEDLGLDPKSVPSWEPVYDAVVVGPDGTTLELRLPSGGLFAASARRVDLDAALLELASDGGAEVIEGHAVVGVEAANPGQGVAVDLDDGRRIVAHFVIAADGMWSPTRKLVGLSEAGYLGDWQAGRQYFTGVGPKARQLWVWFEPDMIPGYTWSFPLSGGTANVGYGVVRSNGQPLGTLRGQRIDPMSRSHVAAVLGPEAKPLGPWKAWPIPAGIGAVTLSALGGRVLFAGDAARACDTMTGEGIAQAFETAELAARAIVASGPGDPGGAASRYSRQVRWGMAVDDHLAGSLSAVLSHRRGVIGALRIARSSAWSRRHFARWMFEDYPRAALVTPHRWQRGMLHRPGAYQAPAGTLPSHV